MSLHNGSRIGPYEVLSAVGAGGMGEVWRARDARIGRDVALKVLPPAFAHDAERLRRFEQEARAAGSLNHPNLVTLYDVGTESGAPFIAMELLEGETLREKLGDVDGAHPLPFRKAMEYACQLAMGLAAAHEKGVVHRDLKPENIFITKDGRLKILDFGLAKLRTDPAVGAADDATQAKGTSPGMVMGTAGYMSPEQVRALHVDQRSDIFSFGAILYEMLSGRRAFRRTSSVETMNAILHEDPPELASSGQHISPAVDRIIRRCLEKSADERFASARDLAFALDAVSASAVSHERVAATAPRQQGRQGLHRSVGVLLLVALAAAAAAALATYRFARPAAATVSTSAAQLTFDAGIENAPSISPDGSTFVFVRGAAPRRQIFLQRVAAATPIALSRTPEDDDHAPAFSPDGTQIAFRSERDGGGIFVMGATGESVRRLTRTGYDPSWSPDGTEVLFASEETVEPTGRSTVSRISVVNVASGSVRELFAGDAMQPRASPDGHRVVYWGIPKSGTAQHDLYTVAMSGDPSTVVAATNDAAVDWAPLWAPDGKSIFFLSDRGGTMNLWRLEIDEESGKPRGTPEPVPAPAAAVVHPSIARDGKQLLYASRTERQDVRFGRLDAATERVTVDPQPVLSGSMRIRGAQPSPDGQWIAFSTEGRENVYVMRADGSERRQLTNDAHRNRGAAWSPDGSRVFFYSTRGGPYDVWSIRTDGSDLTQHTRGMGATYPLRSPDGRRLAIFNLGRGGMIAAMTSGGATEGEILPLLPSKELFWPHGWSPDGSRLIGSNWSSPRARFYVYSLADRRYTPIDADLGPTRVTGASWLDERRVLLSTTDKAVAADITSGAVREVTRVDYPFFSPNGCCLITFTQQHEADVWQLSLAEASAAKKP